MNKTLLVFLGLVVLGVAGYSFFSSTTLGGQLFVDKPSFTRGFFAGAARQFEMTSAGVLSTSGSVTIGSGTAISKFVCTSATWNPGSVATTTIITNTTSTDIAFTGAVVGDLCQASLTSATTSAIGVRCAITGAATATISIANLGTTNAAIDLATGTAKVCYTH